VQRDRATLQHAESPRDVTSCRGTARHYGVQRNCATPRRAEGPRDYVVPRDLGLHVVQRDRATLERTEKPCDATWCRETARHHVVLLDATCCGETARCHVVQRDSAMLQRADKPRDARDHATPRHAEEPRDATACKSKSSPDLPQGVLDRRRGEPDAPCPSRHTLDAGEPTTNTLSVIAETKAQDIQIQCIPTCIIVV